MYTYTPHDFRDVTDSMKDIISKINRLKIEYKIDEANLLASESKDVLGDMLSPTAINELEEGIAMVQLMANAKKKNVIVDENEPVIFYEKMSWIQPIVEEGNNG